MSDEYVTYLIDNVHDKIKRKPHVFFKEFGFGPSQKEAAQNIYRNAVDSLCNHPDRSIREVGKRLETNITIMLESQASEEYWNHVRLSALEHEHCVNMTRAAIEGMKIASQFLNKATKRILTQRDNDLEERPKRRLKTSEHISINSDEGIEESLEDRARAEVIAKKLQAEPSGSQGALRRRPGGAVTANRNTTNRGSSSATMLKFYTDDSPGLKVDPVAVIIIALAFIGSVFLLHIYGKFTRG